MLASWLPRLALTGLYLQTSTFMAAHSTSVAERIPYLYGMDYRWWVRTAVLLLSTGQEGLVRRKREDALLEFLARYLQHLILFLHCQLSVVLLYCHNSLWWLIWQLNHLFWLIFTSRCNIVMSWRLPWMEKVRSLCPVGAMYLLPVLLCRFVSLSLWLSKPIPLIIWPLPHSYWVHL